VTHSDDHRRYNRYQLERYLIVKPSRSASKEFIY